MEVNFRAIKCAVALVYNIGHIHFVKRLLKARRCHFPVLDCAKMVLRHGGKLNVIFKSKLGINLVDKTCNALNLLGYLLASHVNVSVVLGKAANTHKSV